MKEKINMVNQNTISTNIALNNRRMGEKARSTNVQDVCWCCKFLDRTTELFPGYFGLQGDREEKERVKKGGGKERSEGVHTHSTYTCTKWPLLTVAGLRNQHCPIAVLQHQYRH